MRDHSKTQSLGTQPPNPSISTPIDPTRWLELYGDALYNFALARLRQHDLAEDAVQDTLVSAFRTVDSYQGQATERTWLFSILKHKICDCVRKKWVGQTAVSLDDEVDQEERLFESDGRWREAAFCSTRINLGFDELREIIMQCLRTLPRVQAAVFLMRILQEKNSEEICKELELTPSNYWTRFYRARLGLAKCVSEKWPNQ